MNAAAAVAFVVLAAVTCRRVPLNPAVGRTLLLVMLSGFTWSAADAVALAAVHERVAGVASLLIFPGLSATVAAFLWLAGTVARPQWSPGRRFLALALLEPVLITVAALTNPWHQLVYTGAGATQLTGSASWGHGPVFWVHTAYSYVALALGMGMVLHAWWTAPRAFRAQRLNLLVAVLIPVLLNVVSLAGLLPIAMDPTPVGFAITGVLLAYSIFRQDLFTFAPVARAQVIEQISDAIIAVSPVGRVLDLNPAAVTLVRRLRPVTGEIVGARAVDLLGAPMAGTAGEPTDVSVTLDGRPAELHVRSSPLVDRTGRSLGSVLVARDVTEVRAQSRRLEAANTQLRHQVQTIDRLRADLAELAVRDPLTGLHNRRHLVQSFEPMLAAARASGRPLAVVLLDVDRFKAINDTHGHLVGDAVLVRIARLLADGAPDGALVARWGGEEFVVAVPEADVAGGTAFAESVRRRLEDDGVQVGATRFACTLSGGVAAFPVDGTTADELFAAADVSLYRAKTSGRNQVVTGATPRRAREHPVPLAPVVHDRLVAGVGAGRGPGSGGGDRH